MPGNLVLDDLIGDGSRGVPTRLWLDCVGMVATALIAIGIGTRAHVQEAARADALLATVALVAAADPRAQEPRPARIQNEEDGLTAWRQQREVLERLLLDTWDHTDSPGHTAALARWQSSALALEQEWQASLAFSADHRQNSGHATDPSSTLAAPNPRQLLGWSRAHAELVSAQQDVISSWTVARADSRLNASRQQAAAVIAFLALVLSAGGMAWRLFRDLGVERSHSQRQEAQAQLSAHMALASAELMASLDADSRITCVNEAFTRCLGYRSDEAVGKTLRAVLGCALEASDSVAATESIATPAPGRLRCYTKDGLVRWLDVSFRSPPGMDADGPPCLMVATDISPWQREQRHLRSVLATVGTGILVFDRQAMVVDCNPAAEAMLSRTRQQLLGASLQTMPSSLVGSNGEPFAFQDLPTARVLRDGQAHRNTSIGVVTPSGELRWLLVHAEPQIDLDGQLERVITSFTDVTLLRNQQQLLTATLEGAGLGLWEWDVRTGTTTANARLLRMLGYSPGQVQATREALLDLVHPQDRGLLQQALAEHLKDASHPCRLQLRLRRPDGEWAWVLTSATVVERNASARPIRVAGVIVDMTEHMQMQAMLMHTANTDALTQLPNRTQLMARLSAAVDHWRASKSRRFALLYMDFDRFKYVNDTHGHGMGDVLLQQIAERLSRALRRREIGLHPSASQATAARIGGDEFVVLLEGVDALATARAVSERLLATLSEPYSLSKTLRVQSSASIGIVGAEQYLVRAEEPIDAHTVLRDADTAMYEAKRTGRGRCVVFDAEMRAGLSRRAELESDLRLAVAGGQIVPAYQPVMCLRTGQAIGVEALARWQHPQRGAISPAEFIPLAEETGLISELGLVMLRAACRDFVNWQTSSDCTIETLAVNLSRAQLVVDGLVDEVRTVIKETGIRPRHLQLEVTESLAGEDHRVQQALRDLKALGLTLALDDFGTGYSSLACLHLLPVDTVKLDRSFIRDAQTNTVHRVLIQATVQVAEALGMSTVAEGVETTAQADLVKQLGCGKAQGFLFSKPLFNEDLQTWLSAHHVMPGAPSEPPLERVAA